MPYNSIKNLPDSIREHLPVHGQEIFLQTFNHAWEEYGDPDKRRDKHSQEETAFRVAWAAVKEKYRKEGDHWVAM